ncbi:MAG: arsenate reductase (azurin) large subunit [Myxococcota bacterium]|jgi:arsenite oxidase large subunit|nr:arsenate reductase (azurin) large subunit [Myxococcota bacterium]
MSSEHNGDQYVREDAIPLPPKDAEVFTTGCDYCIAGCGYKVFRWPVKGPNGGTAASENALGVDFPAAAMSGSWVSPSMHNVVTANGKKQNVIVLPDPDMKHVNKNGDHSIRGGCIAQKCYNPDTPTRDRHQYPQLRVNGKLERVSWDDATDIMAQVSEYILEKFGVHAWGMKAYSYEFWENTYAITKLAYRSVKTPCFSPHDQPGPGGDAIGLRDVGIDKFSASYDDWGSAEVLFCSGTDPYETKTMIFNEYIKPAVDAGRQKLIYVLPRSTAGVAFAEKTGGLWLDLYPGTDTVLNIAILRIILENGWEDKEFIEKWTNNKWETDSGFGQGTRNTPWQWRTTWGKFSVKGFDDYKKWVLSQEWAELDAASEVTGVAKEKIQKAAEMLAKPINGRRPKASFGLEKGNYWSNNYTNSSSFACLGVVCGAGNRPGQMISRFGGHQRGGRSAGGYPRAESPEKVNGRRKRPIDLDRWMVEGNLRFAWVIGTTWIQAMAGSVDLDNAFKRMTVEQPSQVTSKNVASAVAAIKQRIDDGGMMVVNSDIYPCAPIGTEYADIVLPASGWGEHDFTRANGERRMRVFQGFYDAPGESKPDWWAVAQFAQKMGYEGYKWKDSNEVFEESARFSRGGRTDFYPIVWKAKKDGKKGHDLLSEYGTNGIQGPVRYEYGKLVGTKRLHDSTAKVPTPQGPTVVKKAHYAFNSQTGKLNFIKSPWEIFSDFFDFIKPQGNELWVTNGRVNEVWQSGFDDIERRPYITERWPDNFLEIHPDDAAARGIESGDEVLCYSDRVPVQMGAGFVVEGDDLTFTGLQKKGLIKLTQARVPAVAMVTPAMKKGVTFMNFLHKTASANALVPRVPDPISNRYRFKLGVAFVKKTGESPYKNDLNRMSFAPRIIT